MALDVMVLYTRDAWDYDTKPYQTQGLRISDEEMADP